MLSDLVFQNVVELKGPLSTGLFVCYQFTPMGWPGS